MNRTYVIGFFKRKKEIFLLILILILATFLRIWNISNLNFNGYIFDEIWHSVFALDIMKYGLLRYILTVPNMLLPYQGPMVSYVLIPSLYFFGQTTLALRIPFVIIGILSIIFTYLFAKNFYNKEIALLSSFILAIFPIHVAYSEIAIEVILLPFFIASSLYLLVKYNKTRKRIFLYLFSLICGLGVISRLNFIFYLISLILAIKILPTIKIIKSKNEIKFLLLAILFFIIGVYPIVVYNLMDGLKWFHTFFKKIPMTNFGENLFDLKENLLIALSINFPRFLDGIWFSVPSFSLMVISSLIMLWIITVVLKKHFKPNLIFLKNDTFIITIFLIIFFLTATLTLSKFQFYDYIILTPIVAILAGRAFYEILNVCKGHFLFFHFILFIIGMIFVYNTFSLYNKISTNSENLDRDPDKNLFLCPIYAEKVVDYLGVINNPKLITDFNTYTLLKWYIYKKNLSYDKINLTGFDNISLKNENVLYVLPSIDCTIPAKRYNDPHLKFLNLAKQQNISVSIVKEIRSDSGDVLFTIYRTNLTRFN